MKERTLLKCALICSILGIFGLYVLSEFIDLPNPSIAEIKVMDEGKVKFEGEIVDVRDSGGVVVYTLTNNDVINGVIYDEHQLYNKGDLVRIIGEIDEYNGEKQLNVEKIELNN